MDQIELNSFGNFSKERAEVIANHLETLAKIIRDDPTKIVEFDWSTPAGGGISTTTLKCKD